MNWIGGSLIGIVLGLCVLAFIADTTAKKPIVAESETIYVPLKRHASEPCNDEPQVCRERAIAKYCGGPDRYKLVKQLSSHQWEFVCIPPSSTSI